MLRTCTTAVFAVLLSASVAGAQTAADVVAAAVAAMGTANLTSITYSGTASVGNFGQSRNIEGPLQMTAVTTYTRTIDFTQPASRAFGPTLPPAAAGGPPPQPGTYNQIILPANQAWLQQAQVWTTPWMFLRGAVGALSTVRQQRAGRLVHNIVTWFPTGRAPSGEPYRVVGYINAATNLVDRVETWVDHPVLGDMHIDTAYSDYKDFGGVKVPGTIVQKQGEMEAFLATITAATPNPSTLAELLTPPAGAARAGGPPTPPVLETQTLAPGVFRITGGYVSMAIDMGDYAVVLESGQSEARGSAVLTAANAALPGKEIRYVVNTHLHFDHASGLAAVAAEGITIVTHENNRAYLESALSEQRTLVGDKYSRAGLPPRVEGMRERRTLRGANGRVVDIYHVQGLDHSDGMLMVHLPAEKLLFTADFNIPNAPPAGQTGPTLPIPAFVTLVQNIERLQLDYTTMITVHAPNPDRPVTAADVLRLAGR